MKKNNKNQRHTASPQQEHTPQKSKHTPNYVAFWNFWELFMRDSLHVYRKTVFTDVTLYVFKYWPTWRQDYVCKLEYSKSIDVNILKLTNYAYISS